jgi:integrating conjugative element protein (TIGR03749 family)
MINHLNKIKMMLSIIALLSMTPFATWAVELMKWDRMPIAVPLLVGQERVIFVDSNVRVGLPSSLEGKLRVQSTGGTLYLLASEPIAPTRLQLQDAETGALMLMDIVATKPDQSEVSLEPVQIIEGDHTPIRYGKNSYQVDKDSEQNSATKAKSVPETPIPVVLTRYASQNLYAPLRTVEPVRGVSRVNINSKLNLASLLPTQAIKSNVLAAWKLDNYVVSAVKLTNTCNELIELDPRLLQGDFIAATFQHQTLGPKGQATDTTVVYLVTYQKGLANALLPTISRFDAMQGIYYREQGVDDEK